MEWLIGKESTFNAGDVGSIPGLERSPGERNGRLLQCSCLGNPRDRGAWWAAVYGVAQSRTRLKRPSSSSSSSYTKSQLFFNELELELKSKYVTVAI